jgi:hypothetical protein
MNESSYFRVCGLAAVLWAAPALSADASMPKDLKATIVLQGQPCSQVVSSKRNSDSDYTVTCKDGGRYHVFVDSNGRVIVARQGA